MYNIIPDSALPNHLQMIFGGYSNSGIQYTFHLYKNDVTPDQSTVLGDFMELDTGTVPDYLPIVATGWGPAFLSGHVETYEADLMTWYFAAGATTAVYVYGVYVTRNDGAFMWAQRFVSPYNINVGSYDEINYLPRFSDNSKYAS